MDEIELALAKHFVKMTKEMDYEEWIAYLALMCLPDKPPYAPPMLTKWETQYRPFWYKPSKKEGE